MHFERKISRPHISTLTAYEITPTTISKNVWNKKGVSVYSHYHTKMEFLKTKKQIRFLSNRTSVKLLIIEILYTRSILSTKAFYYWKLKAASEESSG